MVKATKSWVPDRRDIIWIDCNPQQGQEIRDIHPFLVLSPSQFNARTSLVIGLPMTTAQHNEDNPFALPVRSAKGRKADKIIYVLCHQPKSFDWRQRLARPHSMGKIENSLFNEVRVRLNQILQLT
jgi:mRNA interferase MazF